MREESGRAALYRGKKTELRWAHAAMISVRTATLGDVQDLFALDDSASVLYEEAGLPMGHLTASHPLCAAERERWKQAVREQGALVAIDSAAPNEPLGFAVMGLVDGAPYLDQLSVHRAQMRRGVGTCLVRSCVDWSKARRSQAQRLLLTTYSHLPFNRPFYERLGFVLVPEAEHGPELRAILEEQRRFLPDPGQRIAMALTL